MSAREELERYLTFSGHGPERRKALIDAYAHELAEKQRAWAREPEKVLRANVPEQLATVIAAVPIVDAAADLIDPVVLNSE